MVFGRDVPEPRTPELQLRAMASDKLALQHGENPAAFLDNLNAIKLYSTEADQVNTKRILFDLLVEKYDEQLKLQLFLFDVPI